MGRLVYLAISFSFSLSNVKQLINHLAKPFILPADFNDYGKLWGWENTNARSEEDISKQLDDIILLNNNQMTTQRQRRKKSIIDLIIASSSITEIVDRKVAEELHGSGHYIRIILLP